MTNWIPFPINLTGQLVDLISLDRIHLPGLSAVAKDKRIWEHYNFDGSDPSVFLNTQEEALANQEKGTLAPLVIFYKPENKIIGSTRLMEINIKHRKLEIGSTWLHPDHWGTAVNLECKLMLLTFCFETLKTARVQLRTDENNIRSRKAIEKIGGQFEGILRNDMRRDNGTSRNSAYFSLIDSEWADKKSRLKILIQNKRKSEEV